MLVTASAPAKTCTSGDSVGTHATDPEAVYTPTVPAEPAVPAELVVSYCRPRGRAPKGKVWDSVEGAWVRACH